MNGERGDADVRRDADDELEHLVRPATGRSSGEHRRPPEGALLLLHGRGSDERDLLPLLDELDPWGRRTGVTLRAPLALPPRGYHWYVVGQVGRPDGPTFRQTYEAISAWLDRLPSITGVGLDRTVIGGFSQGAVMAYALGLGRGRPSPAAVLAFSGFIPEAPGFFTLDLEGHRDVPVAIGHGALDKIIPVQFGRSAAERLRMAGLDVTYHESAMMAHGIDGGYVRDLADWLSGGGRLERRAA